MSKNNFIVNAYFMGNAMAYFPIKSELLFLCQIQRASSVVEITVGHQLKLNESQELPTKKVTENPILTNRFIIFYCSYED